MPKIFAKESWDEVKYLPKKFRGFIDLLRPFTLLAPLIGGTCGALMASGFNNFTNFDPLLLVYGVGTLVLVNGASNALNQVYDVEIDRINKFYRPIPSGVVTKDEARTVACLLFFFALFRATLINYNFALTILLIMCIAVLYSMNPVRLKKRLWISNIAIALPRGLLGFIAAWCIFGELTDKVPWIVGAILFVYLIGASTTKDFPDVEGDRKYQIRTLPVVYGKARSILIIAPFFVLPFALIPLGVGLGILRRTTIQLVALVAWGVYVVFLLRRYADVPDKRFENTPVWIHMYLLLLALQMGFCITYLA